MTLIEKLAALAAISVATVPLIGSAQGRGEIVFYSDIAFRGRTFAVTGPRDYARVPFTVRSARVAPGESWQICSDVQYRGRCNVVDQSQGNIAWTVNSVRPSRGTTPPVSPPANPESLRGMSSEFFVQPSSGGRRMESCASGAAACAKQSANRFCQSRGWTASSYERQETVAGRNYLADVLCTRTR